MFKERKKKVLFFLPNLNGGGAERVTVTILRQLDENKFQIFLVLVDSSGKLSDLIPSHVKIYDLRVKKTMFSIFKLRKIIRQIKPNFVFSTLYRTHIAVYIAQIGINKKPTIIFRSPNSPKLLLRKKQLNRFMIYLLERAYKKADLIIAQTPEMKEEIIDCHAIEDYKIKVLLNPIDTDLINQKVKNIQNPFDSNYRNVIAAGRLTEQKGFDVLINSFKRIIQKNDKFRLYIIGANDGARIKLVSLVRSLELDENVFFLGFQTNPYKYFYYSDLYVLSSRWEGLPNTVLENLYLKKPIVATKCISFMETLIENGKNGILVEIENQETLATAILNYEKINVEHITIDFTTSNFEEVFI